MERTKKNIVVRVTLNIATITPNECLLRGSSIIREPFLPIAIMKKLALTKVITNYRTCVEHLPRSEVVVSLFAFLFFLVTFSH